MLCINAGSLSKSYGNTTAVDCLDLSVESGQVFGFLGPNGAGKSTTIKLLTALVRPSSGSLEVLGIDAIKNPLAVRSRIGVVLQQPSYEPTLSVEKSLDKYGMMWDVPSSIRRRRVDQLLSDFELTEIRKKKNEDLSIGQRRRVQVAREFMHDMDLLFLDEPTVGLDPSARRKLLDFLKNKTRSGLTIFYTTHVLTEAEYLCNNIAIINRGRIVTIDTPESLKGTYGRQKTIKIRISGSVSRAELDGVPNCTVDEELGLITINSDASERILPHVLDILHKRRIAVEDLSVVPTNLEEIFLKMTGEMDASGS